MNLGRRVNLNINSRQNCSRFSLKYSLDFSFCSPSAIVLPVLHNFLRRRWNITKLSSSIYECHFLREKLGEKLCLVVFSRWMSARQLGKRGLCKLQATIAYKGGNFGPKLTHLCGFWSDVSFLSHIKKHRSRGWLNVSLFSHLKDIVVPSSDWLEIICVWTFQWVSQ